MLSFDNKGVKKMKKLKTSLISLCLIAILSIIAISAPIQAQGIESDLEFGEVPQPSGLGNVSLEGAVLNVITIVLSFLGLVALVVILIGGFKWMTSGGNEEKIGEAKKLMGAGIVGLLIIVASYAIATFVMNSLLDIGGSETEDELGRLIGNILI